MPRHDGWRRFDHQHAGLRLSGRLPSSEPAAVDFAPLPLAAAPSTVQGAKVVLPLKRLLGPVAPWMRWSTRAPAFALWPHVSVTPEVHRVEAGMSAGLWAYAE